MKWLYSVIALIVVALGLGFSLSFKDDNNTENILKYQKVESLSLFQQQLFDVFSSDFKTQDIFFLGVHPNSESDMKFWSEFISLLAEKGIKFDKIIIDPNLSYKKTIQYNEEFDSTAHMIEFHQGLQTILKNKIKTLIIVPSIYSTHLLKDNPLDLIRKTLNVTPFSLSLVEFPMNQDEENNLQYPCRVENDMSGQGALGCAVLVKARSLYRKKLKGEGWGVLVEKMSDNDYLVFKKRINY